MDVACQSGLELDFLHMLLIVEDALIQMTDAPTQGDVVVEELGELCCSLTGVGVAPGAEGHENLIVGTECHIAVHHSRDADAGENLYLGVVLLEDILAEIGIAVLKTEPDSLGAVGPETVHQLILPCVRTLCDRLVFLVHEDSLNAGRAKLDTENGFTCKDSFFRCHNYLKALLSM